MTDRLTLAAMLDRYRQNWPEVATRETEIMVSLIRLNDLIDTRSRAVMADFDLTLAGFETLATLRGEPAPGAMTPNQLRQAVLITSGGMTKVLNTLAADGLITLTRHETDRRSKLIALTAAGKTRIEECMAALGETDRDLLGQSLSDGEIDQLRTLLTQTVAKLEAD